MTTNYNWQHIEDEWRIAFSYFADKLMKMVIGETIIAVDKNGNQVEIKCERQDDTPRK